MTINIKEFEKNWMGKRIFSPTRLIRQCIYDPTTSRDLLIWVEEPTPVEGWVVGISFKQDGYIIYYSNSYEEPGSTEWKCTGVVTAVMVAESCRKKAVAIPVPNYFKMEECQS